MRDFDNLTCFSRQFVVCDAFFKKYEQAQQRHCLSLSDSNSCLLSQASRLFDEEGRKKFFTLDMNNILLE